MATATQLFTDRDTAGAAYASALTTLRTAWINLRALDLACTSLRVLASHPTGATKTPVSTFANVSSFGGEPLRHPVYAGMPDVVGWDRTALANAEVHLNTLS